MAYSDIDQVTRALRVAGLIGSEEVPSAPDLEFGLEGIASDTAALAVEGVTILNGSAESVPLEQLQPRAEYHAVTFKNNFGMISDAEAIQTKAAMLPRLRRLCVKPATGATAQNDYF